MLRNATPTALVTVVLVAAACAPATAPPTPALSNAATLPISESPSAGASESAGTSESAGASQSAGPSESAGASAGATGSVPQFDPANFVATVDNPWFPLIPGTTFTYRGSKDGERAQNVFQVTRQTKTILGVTTTVVHDTLTINDEKAEETDDWYAQDKDGNVWYLGEATKEFDEIGKVISTEGSWEAGVDGAVAGIYMPADPQVGQSFAQEFYAGHAEDHFVVLLRNAQVKVAYGSFRGALLTAEWTPLEPQALGQKFYAKGVGQVMERSLAGESERMELVALRKP
jgi:hypothetical protein